MNHSKIEFLVIANISIDELSVFVELKKKNKEKLCSLVSCKNLININLHTKLVFGK